MPCKQEICEKVQKKRKRWEGLKNKAFYLKGQGRKRGSPSKGIDTINNHALLRTLYSRKRGSPSKGIDTFNSFSFKAII